MQLTDFVKVDNNTFEQKAMLRRTALEYITSPVVCETHGGWGELFEAVYGQVREGMVVEKDPQRAEFLSRQRPTWEVYEADSAAALAMGAGAHLTVNVLDVDPYSDPWPTIQGFFRAPRQMAGKMVVVVNDGLRQMVRSGTSWQSTTLAPIVAERGNNLWSVYLDVCKDLMQRAIMPADYRMTFFDGYYTGHSQRMTHYLAVLEK